MSTLHFDGEDWATETLTEVVADWTPILAAVSGLTNEVAFASYQEHEFQVRLRTGEEWLEVERVEASQGGEMIFGGDDGIWLAVDSADDARLVHVGDCELELEEIASPVALAPSDTGVTAYGFDWAGVPWRLDVDPGCNVERVRLGGAVGKGLSNISIVTSGSAAVLVGDFFAARSDSEFEETFEPLCY